MFWRSGGRLCGVSKIASISKFVSAFTGHVCFSSGRCDVCGSLPIYNAYRKTDRPLIGIITTEPQNRTMHDGPHAPCPCPHSGYSTLYYWMDQLSGLKGNSFSKQRITVLHMVCRVPCPAIANFQFSLWFRERSATRLGDHPQLPLLQPSKAPHQFYVETNNKIVDVYQKMPSP